MNIDMISPKVIIVSSIIILIILSFAFGYIGAFNPIWLLNESQILYLHSTSAQVIAGIYGLTLTGFIFFRNELSRDESEDETLTDIIASLKSRYYKLLVFITIFSIFTLLICNFAISIEGKSGPILGSVILNFAQVSFFTNLISIAYFIFDVISPRRIENASEKLQQEFDPVIKDKDLGSLENFLKTFNKIEYILQKYGQEFQYKNYNSSQNTKKFISNKKLAQIILQSQKIDIDLYDEINRLITLRNSIIHSTEPIVSLHMVDTSKIVLDKLSIALGINDDLFSTNELMSTTPSLKQS